MGVFFITGATLWVHQDTFKDFKNGLIVTLILIIGALYFNQFYWLKYLLLPCLVIFSGQIKSISMRYFSRLGEPSYGIYIYSFPIQQAIIQWLHPTPMVLIALSIPISYCMGYISWHLVEKHFIKPRGTVSI